MTERQTPGQSLLADRGLGVVYGSQGNVLAYHPGMRAPVRLDSDEFHPQDARFGHGGREGGSQILHLEYVQGIRPEVVKFAYSRGLSSIPPVLMPALGSEQGEGASQEFDERGKQRRELPVGLTHHQGELYCVTQEFNPNYQPRLRLYRLSDGQEIELLRMPGSNRDVQEFDEIARGRTMEARDKSLEGLLVRKGSVDVASDGTYLYLSSENTVALRVNDNRASFERQISGRISNWVRLASDGQTAFQVYYRGLETDPSGVQVHRLPDYELAAQWVPFDGESPYNLSMTSFGGLFFFGADNLESWNGDLYAIELPTGSSRKVEPRLILPGAFELHGNIGAGGNPLLVLPRAAIDDLVRSAELRDWEAQARILSAG